MEVYSVMVKVLYNPVAVTIGLIIFIASVLIYVHFVRPLSYFKRAGIPGPPPSLIFGNVLEFRRHGTHIAHLNWVRQYGKVFGIMFGRSPVIMVADPDMVKAVTVKYSQNFIDRWSIYTPSRPLCLGLFSLGGHAWKRVRTILSPAFTTAKLKLVVPYVTRATCTLRKKLNTSIDNHEIIDIWKWYGQLTMEVILATSFGVKVSAQENPDQLTREAHRLFGNYSLRALVAVISPTLFHLTKKFFKKDKESILYIEHVLRKVVQERRQLSLEEKANYTDILQSMLEAQDGDKLSDDEVIGQCMQFLFAGYETTASALAFTTYLLAVNPDIQSKLRSEINQTCSINDNITYDTLASMKYLEMVISESLRMYPPAFSYIHRANTDTMINGFIFSKDVGVGIPVYAIHHDPEYWRDPEKFDPERFANGKDAIQHPGSYLPFGMGPRTCIGARLALLEAKMVLVMLLLEFSFETIDQTEVPLTIKSGVTLFPKNGIRLGVRRL